MQKTFTLYRGCMLLLFLFSVCAASFTAKAQSIYAADLSYTYIRGDSVRVTINVYASCKGMDINNFLKDVEVIPEKSNSFYVATKFVSMTNVNSFVKKGQCTQCTSTGCSFNFGIRKYVFESIVYLKNYSDCKFTFAFTGYSRTENTSQVYIEAKMNRCVDGYVNSPQFSYDAISLLCKDQCLVKMHSALGNSNDSLVYSLTPPEISALNKYTYSGSNNYLSPISHTASSTSCGGFTLDKFTGKLTFTPTLDEISPMAIKVEQYHPDSTGKMVKVGEIVRDLTLLIIGCPANNSPVLNAANGDATNYYVCAGNSINITFSTSDADAADTVHYAYMLSMKNASFTNTTKNKKWNAGKFSWTPEKSDIQRAPHQIMLTAYDDASPILGKAEKVYYVYVIGSRPEITIKQEDKGCGYIVLSPAGDDTSTITSYSWQINDVITKNKATVFQATKNGNYIVKLSTINKAGCESVYIDTVKITDLPGINIGNDTIVCAGKSFQINKSANTAYTYKWKPSKTISSDVIASPYITPLTSEDYIVEVSNNKGCKSIDTLKVTVPALGFSLPKDTTVCINKAVTLRIKATKDVIYNWSPTTGLSNPNDTVITIYPQQTTTYIVTAKNALGCIMQDSVKITVSAAKADAGGDVSICKGTGTTLHGKGGYSYAWLNNRGDTLSKTADVYVNPMAKEEYYLNVDDSLHCQHSVDNVMVNISTLPLQIIKDTTICQGDTILLWADGGDIYKWLPENTLSDINSNTTKAFPLETTTYAVQIQDTLKACSDKRSVTIYVNKDCVWPGDANKDGIVDYKDVLELGVGYGSTGNYRENGTQNWKSAQVKDWNKFTYNNINYKHLDCNGDGYIDAADNFVISDNYGKTHASTFISRTAEISRDSIYFRFDKDTFYAREIVTANLNIGSKTNPFTNAYGVAYQYAYTDKNNSSNTVSFKPVCDAICANNDFILQSLHNYPATKSGEIAQVRTDLKNISANGKIATFSYILEDSMHNYPTNGEWIYLKLTQTKIIDNQGKEYALKAVNDSAFVLRSKAEQVGIEQSKSISEQIHIYPNPVNTHVTIETGNHIFSEINIVNILGETVVSIKQNATKANVNTSNLQPGIYFARIKLLDQYIQYKLIITK